MKKILSLIGIYFITLMVVYGQSSYDEQRLVGSWYQENSVAIERVWIFNSDGTGIYIIGSIEENFEYRAVAGKIVFNRFTFINYYLSSDSRTLIIEFSGILNIGNREINSPVLLRRFYLE